MKLNARAVLNAKYEGRPKKLTDGAGLYLHVTATGKFWRYNYRHAGRQKEYTIGPASLVSLSEARERHRQARLLVLDGRDPVAERTAARRADLATNTVGALVDDWHERGAKSWAPSNSTKKASRLRHLSARFRATRLNELTPSAVLDELQAAANRRSADLAHRLLTYLRAALDEAVADETIESNPARHPKVTLKLQSRPPQTRYPHVTEPDVLAGVLRAIDAYVGDERVRRAMWLMPRLFLRPGELRGLRWDEVQLADRQLVIDAGRMKGRLEHVVPLADQCHDVIARLAETRAGDYVFHGPRSRTRPISDMTLSAGLARVGVSNTVIVPHGFRHTASTMLHDREFVVDGVPTRFRSDAIERQLAHVQRGIRARYNRAEYIVERRQMMQAYADWLDAIAHGTTPPGPAERAATQAIP